MLAVAMQSASAFGAFGKAAESMVDFDILRLKQIDNRLLATGVVGLDRDWDFVESRGVMTIHFN